MTKILVFGSSGQLGSEIVNHLEKSGGVDIVCVNSRQVLDSKQPWLDHAVQGDQFTGVVWAQGANHTDSIRDFDEHQTERILEANVIFIMKTLHELLRRNLLLRGARLVIISSVWQNTARSNKLSYSVSKSALKGLVGSLVADLQEHRVAVNAVLPGVVDSPMSRANLTAEQISKIQLDTPGGELVRSLDVAKVACWLLSPESEGINGQSIAVDNGWGAIRHV